VEFYQISECQSPVNKRKAPPIENLLATVLPDPLASGFLVKLVSVVIRIDKTATMPRFRNILIVILAITLYTGNFGLYFKKT